MARLETQINQIYLTHPETKNASLILYEEALSASTHLFILAELRDLQKKSEAHDLKKISEIILTSFRTNKKLSGEALFEASLAQINQNLADIAHEGRKSWVGKFSCIIALRANDNIYLANSGQASGWLRRQSELLEILPAEKRGDHPLKTFVNFIQGKISENDALILTSANVFNYVSTELYAKILNNNTLAQACQEISKILQTALGSNQSFSSFFLEFTKKQSPSFAEVLPEAAPVYAPLPEDIKNSEEKPSQFKIRLPAIPNIKLPKFNFRFRIRIPKISFGFFQRLGKAGKFFFISFSLFAVLFIINLGVYGFKLRDQHAQEALTKQIALVNEDITKTRSALIIKDNQQALVQLAQTLSDFNSLKKLSPTQADQFTAELEKLTNQVNKTSVAQSPQVYAEFKRHPIYLAKSPTGFLLSAADSNSVSSFDKTNKDYFLLNSLKTGITSIGYWQPVGVVVTTADTVYHIDEGLKQFEPVLALPNDNIIQVQTYNNNLYALDTKNGQIIKITDIKGKFTTTVIARGDYSQIRDFAIDKDIYLLSADSVTKITNGNALAFPLPPMTDKISNGTRIFVAGNIYILEANKKRVVILNKTGALLNQISFPTATTPEELSVDEAQRSLYLLDDNQLLRITY